MNLHRSAAAVAVGALAAFGSAASAQEASMTKVSDSVYHYFSFNYSSMVVVGDEAVLVTDPSFEPRGSQMLAAVQEITDKPVKYVLISHEHYDHAGGVDSYSDAQTICHIACAGVLAISPFLPVAEIDVTFEDSLTVDLGGVTVDMVHIAPGDGIATTVVHVPSEGVVFSADLYDVDHFTESEFLEDKNFVGVRLILHEMLGWNPSYVIDGHTAGNTIEGLKENIVLYDRLYEDVRGRLAAASEEGPAALWTAMFAMQYEVPAYEEYSHWENYEAGFPAYVRRMALSILHGG